MFIWTESAPEWARQSCPGGESGELFLCTPGAFPMHTCKTHVWVFQRENVLCLRELFGFLGFKVVPVSQHSSPQEGPVRKSFPEVPAGVQTR